jgi:hypothetical protein
MVILGIRMPFAESTISIAAELFGVAVPMPTFCANETEKTKEITKVKKPFFINYFLNSKIKIQNATFLLFTFHSPLKLHPPHILNLPIH